MKFQVEEKGLQIETDIENTVPLMILNDQKRYKQVLFNLIGNAVKFTYTGRITIHVKVANGHLVTSVSDTGMGISKDDLKKLFQFFGKLSKSSDINRGGMGLGLTISKMIV